MERVKKLRHKLTDLQTNEDGSMATMFSVSLLTILLAVGTTFDINQVQTSSFRSQHVSDMVGLMATVHVKNHGKPPTKDSEGFVNNKTYSAKAEGFDIGPATQGGNDVTFKVTYDQTNAQAIVTMNGTVETSFMGMFGQSSLGFNRKTVVKYAQSDLKDPASVFLVMDNSGSMAWDDKPRATRYGSRPAGAQARIQGLKKTVVDFNEYLGESVGGSTSGKTTEYLRMGMTAYNTNTINSRTVNPNWGTLSNSKINGMVAGGGTNSSNSMNTVYNWMKGEDAKHKAKTGSKPLKYVIFMTDGVNNQEYVCEWKNQSGTNYWRKVRNNGTYQYRSSWRQPGGRGWTEGRNECGYVNTANIETLKTCTKLKNDGVEVYTIGYALEPGTYATNPPSNQWSTTQSASSTTIAYDFLNSCASSPDHFVKAENTDGLKAAFDKIGADIVADVVRIAS